MPAIGAPAQGGITCAKCGTVNEPGRVYCVYCGEALAAPVTAPVPPPVSSGRRIPVIAIVGGVALVALLAIGVFALKGSPAATTPSPTVPASAAAVVASPSTPASLAPTPAPTASASVSAAPLPPPPDRPIVYSMTTTSTLIWSIPATGGKATQLVKTGTNSGAGWSRDAKHISWVRRVGSAPIEVWVMNANGSSAHALTSGAHANDAPSWSPSGDRIAFAASFGASTSQIWIIPAAGGKAVRLTSVAGGARWPSWSPDGHSIVYVSPTNGQSSLWRIDPENPAAGAVQLTAATSGADHSPTWSPDGTRIAFDSSRDGTDRIYVMNADGSNAQAVTPPSLPAAWPAWSPDGSQLVFEGTKGADRDLYLVPANGSAAPTDLTNDPDHNEFAAGWW